MKLPTFNFLRKNNLNVKRIHSKSFPKLARKFLSKALKKFGPVSTVTLSRL